MRFRRAQLRYSDTPVPVTPYQAAAQAWDERIGSARVQARSWRLMAFGCLGLALVMSGALVWRAGHDQRETEAAEGHQTPTAGLHARRPDAFVPGLRSGLVRGHGHRRVRVAQLCATEAHGQPPSS